MTITPAFANFLPRVDGVPTEAELIEIEHAVEILRRDYCHPEQGWRAAYARTIYTGVRLLIAAERERKAARV